MTSPFRPYDKQGKLLLRTFIDLETQILRLLPDLPWIRLLVRGLLVALEDRWIEAKVQSSVEGALAAYRASEAPPTTWRDDVVITESPSSVPGLPELNLRASWYDRQ